LIVEGVVVVVDLRKLVEIDFEVRSLVDDKEL
jgi:hypothetical protein